MITCFLIPLTSLIYWSTPPHVGKLGREAWAWFKANGRAHGVLFWGTSLLGGGRAGPAPECGSLMPRSRTRSVRVLVKKRRGNVTKMTPGGVTHMFKLDPLGRPSTLATQRQIGHIDTSDASLCKSKRRGWLLSVHVNCSRNFLRMQKGRDSCFCTAWIN